MAYADQQGMSTNRLISIILVALLHAGIGFALVSGLAYEAYKRVKDKIEVVDVQEEKKEEPPPPPPEIKKFIPPPVVVPESKYQRESTNEQVVEEKKNNDDERAQCPGNPDYSYLVKSGPGSCPPRTKDCYGKAVAYDAPCSEPMKTCEYGPPVPQSQRCGEKPVEKKNMSKKASPRNSQGGWVTTSDYPSRAETQRKEGTTRVNLTIGADGRVTGCSVTGSAGDSSLDSAACSNITRRARFNPALDADGNPTSGSFATYVKWQLPPE